MTEEIKCNFLENGFCILKTKTRKCDGKDCILYFTYTRSKRLEMEHQIRQKPLDKAVVN